MTIKYKLDYTSAFKRDIKAIKKRGLDMELLVNVITLLQCGEVLEPKHKDHQLSGNWKGYRECHIQPDWLLIYEIIDDTLVLSLTRTGTHSDLFGK